MTEFTNVHSNVAQVVHQFAQNTDSTTAQPTFALENAGAAVENTAQTEELPMLWFTRSYTGFRLPMSSVALKTFSLAIAMGLCSLTHAATVDTMIDIGHAQVVVGWCGTHADRTRPR